MTSEPLDVTKWLQELMTHAWADQARRAEWYTEIMQRVARGELDVEHVRDEVIRFAGDETANYGREVVQLGIHFYSSLLDLSRTYDERFCDRLLRPQGRHARARQVNQHEGPRQITIDLRGEVGGEAAAAFVIENRRNATAQISFIVSDFADTAGGSRFRPPLDIQPSRLTLGPHEEAEVKLRLPLLDKLFRPGRQYWTRVVVSGHDDLELIVTVNVEPVAEPATRVSVVASREAPPAEAPVGPKTPVRAKKTSNKSARARGKITPRSRAPRKRPDGAGPRG